MRYEDFAYLWPPRPEIAVDPSMLHVFQRRGHVAQIKMNGTANVIFVAPDKTVTAMSRHNEDHKQWNVDPAVMRDFSALPGKGWYVFVAELMHNKVPGIKNVNYVHDILVNDGEYLVGMTQEERQDILHDRLMTDHAVEAQHHYVVSPNLWLPIEYEGDFNNIFSSLKAPEYEGIVLKDPKQKLAVCSRASSNKAGQVKCRKTHKNFSF